MKETHIIANRFREVILNGTFIANTNYKDQLVDSQWEIATKKIGTLNTVAELAQHIHYYIEGVNRVFKGGALDIKDQYSFDFAPHSFTGTVGSFPCQVLEQCRRFCLPSRAATR